jgi:transposase-like protein
MSRGVSTTSRRPKGHRGGFQPPFCPNPECANHAPHSGGHFPRWGRYVRRSDGRSFQTFRCNDCHHLFSTRAFSPTYWLRRRDLLRPITALSAEGPALRQIARLLETTHATVSRLLSRGGRQCSLVHLDLLAHASITEPLIIDGFESFEFSQYFPFHLNLAVGQDSWFLYLFTDSPLRRKGRMSPAQAHRRAQLEATLGRPDPKAVELGVANLLADLLPKVPHNCSLLLHSDDHPAYPRALRRALQTCRTSDAQKRVQHCVTSSKVRRTQRNPLFPVNLADLLLRHANANHRRETIAFSKRRQAAIERAVVFTVWRNAIKSRRENAPGQTAAMAAGVLSQPLSWREVFARRRFPAHVELPPTWAAYYWARVKTLIYRERQRVHALKWAF